MSFVPSLNADVELKTKSYIRKRITSLSDLEANIPIYFSYPKDDDSNNNFIVKLQVKAAGGVGEESDIVAFNQYCTHMGASLKGRYNKIHKIMGACPQHLTTFDLTRHGMVVSGHATASLPQIMLEVSDGEVYAIGISGLMYGFSQNPIPTVTPKIDKVVEKKVTKEEPPKKILKIKKETKKNINKDLIYKNIARYHNISFLQFENILKIKTDDKLIKHYMLSNPCRIVADFTSDKTLNTKSYKFSTKPFTKIRIGSHKAYYRVVITLDKEYSYKTTVKDSGILFECY